MQLFDAALQLQNPRDVQRSVLVAATGGLSVLPQPVVQHGVLLFVEFQLVVDGHQHLLLQFVQKHRSVVGERVREGRRFEGLVVPNLAGQQQTGYYQSK